MAAKRFENKSVRTLRFALPKKTFRNLAGLTLIDNTCLVSQIDTAVSA